MRQVMCLVLAVLLIVPAVTAQEPFLPMPPSEVETILDLLDAVDAAQIAILENPESITEENLAELRELVTVAETIGAQDLAARTRTLIVLASFDADRESPVLAPVEGELTLGDDAPLTRDTLAFRRWVNIGATAGATALGMSAVFYYLAERNYQAWLDETDPVLSDQFYQAYRGYDFLSLGLGGATLLSVGVGMPVIFALTPPSARLATPPEAVIYTRAEREAELDRLYAEREQIITRINRLNTQERGRTLATTISAAVGAVGAIAAGTFYYLADQEYDLYLAATTTEDAEALSKRVSLLDLMAVIGAGVGGAGFGFAATVGIVTPSRTELERNLKAVNEAIIRVRSSRTISVPASATGDTNEAAEEAEAQ